MVRADLNHDWVCPPALIDFACSLADQARASILRYYRRALDITVKGDLSPVTRADRETEALLRRAIAATYPDHGIIGEEYGAERDQADYVWVLDPIDGTKSFISGRPLFGTLIALTKGRVPVLGIIDMPALAERWIGAVGHPSRMNGHPVRCRDARNLAEASCFSTHPAQFAGTAAAGFSALAGQAGFTLYGSDCYHYGLVASGYADLAVEAAIHIYDYMAAVPVIVGAGGIMTDWSGQSLTLDSGDRVIAAATQALHHEALRFLSTEERV